MKSDGTIVVVNTRPRDFVLPTPITRKRVGHTTRGFRLKPGANAVEEALLDEILKDTSRGSGKEVQDEFNRGGLKFQNEKELAPANKASAAEAVVFVKSCKDIEELTRIALNDTRKTVQDAVHQRLLALAPKE